MPVIHGMKNFVRTIEGKAPVFPSMDHQFVVFSYSNLVSTLQRFIDTGTVPRNGFERCVNYNSVLKAVRDWAPHLKPDWNPNHYSNCSLSDFLDSEHNRVQLAELLYDMLRKAQGLTPRPTMRAIRNICMFYGHDGPAEAWEMEMDEWGVSLEELTNDCDVEW